jgi:hypothetical protein
MSKDPTPRADQLRQQREERYGHLQATAETPAGYTSGAKARPQNAPPARKLIPYAGQVTKGVAPPTGKRTEAQKAITAAKKARQRVKRKRRTELPPEGTET